MLLDNWFIMYINIGIPHGYIKLCQLIMMIIKANYLFILVLQLLINLQL